MEIELQNKEQSNHVMIPSDIDSVKHSANKNWFPMRYRLAFTLLLCVLTLYSLRINFSMAIIEMTNNRSIEINGTVYNQQEFNWNSKVKGLVLSMNSWGDFASVVGVLIVRKFGGITAYGFGLLLGGIINILHPFTLRLNFYLFLVMRVLEGVFEVLTFVSTFEIWSKWALKKDRSTMMGIQFAGVYIGNVVIFPAIGYIAHTWHWPVIFYFTGGMASVAAIILLLSFTNDPLNDKHVSLREREYMMQEFEEPPSQEAIPWKVILSSKPVWAVVVLKFCSASGYSFMTLSLPMYIKDISNLQIHKVGILSGIPNVASIISVPLSGYLADYIQNKKILSPTQMHKTYIMFGHVLGAVCLFIIAFQPNFSLNIILFIIFKVLSSTCFLSTLLIVSYMAPNHSSLVASITSYGHYCGSMWTPLLLGFVVTTHNAFEWTICLTILGTVVLAGAVIYFFIGTSEPQPWSRAPLARDDSIL